MDVRRIGEALPDQLGADVVTMVVDDDRAVRAMREHQLGAGRDGERIDQPGEDQRDERGA